MVERRLVAVRGLVQGVGFRPYVRGLAATHGLRGQVWNDCSGLMADLEGEGESLDCFLRAMRTQPPPLAVIESITFEEAPPAHFADLTFASSVSHGALRAEVAPDAATCDACVAELFDPANRRNRHPFISCTQCGPRFTIMRAIPYDRARTTMAGFPMCPTCRAEYSDPSDRRFHAQPIACQGCGPTLDFRRSGATSSAQRDEALTLAVAAIARGEIVAVKGLGGFHLCCDALDEAAVLRLRKRKRREARPLAIIVRDLNAAGKLAEIGSEESTLLRSVARPIVLLRARKDSPLAPSVAPGLPTIGIMLA